MTSRCTHAHMHTHTVSTSTHCYVWQSCADLLPADGCVEGCPAILVLLIHAGPMLNEEGEGLHVPVGGSNVHLMVRRASQHWLRCSTHAHTQNFPRMNTQHLPSHTKTNCISSKCVCICVSLCVYVSVCTRQGGATHCSPLTAVAPYLSLMSRERLLLTESLRSARSDLGVFSRSLCSRSSVSPTNRHRV